jgi:cell division protease FtsH
MLKQIFFCSLYFFIQINSLNIQPDDTKLIYKYKNYFVKDNYNNMVNNIINNKVSKVYLDKNFKEIITVDKEEKNIYDDNTDLNILYNYDKYHKSNIDPILVPGIIDKSFETSTPIIISDMRPDYLVTFDNGLNFLSSSFSLLVPLLLFSSFLSFMSRMPRQNMLNRQTNLLNPFTQPNKNMMPNSNKVSNITLNNWAGSPEVIEDCKEIIKYIENKEIFNKMGAEMPKGILLEGPPGTGKTLLAKAIAGETNSSFFSISGSEFVELFVGMGASRVRELFANARENNPSIIFIDEIDAVARQRGAGINMANDEREQTLNQLLYEMDGFNSNENIVVIAATNRKDVLDQAILRPGRFDRIIRIPLPDKDSREKIIGYYLNAKNITENLNTSSIAELTDGFSGAQLKNLINEAIILSARNNYTNLQEKYIFEAFEKSIVGLIKKNATI